MQENWTHGHSKSPSIKPELGHESLLHGGFESVPACHRGVEWDRGPFMCVLQEISVAILLLIRVYLCVCLSMRPSHRKSWITFERLNGFRWNFNVLLRWSGVTFGWVIRLPSPSQGGPSLQPVLFPKVEQVRGRWCYQIVSYHFGKLLLSQTTMAEQIFEFVAGVQFLGYEGGDPPEGVNLC